MARHTTRRRKATLAGLVWALHACDTNLEPVDIAIGDAPLDEDPYGDVVPASTPSLDTAPEQEEEPEEPEAPAPDPCDTLPPLPTTWEELPFVPASEDFGFDDQGHLVNVGDALNSLARTTRTGDVSVVTTYTSPDLAGIAMMPGGDVLVCNEAEGVVMRIAMDGSRSELATGLLSPNSITVSDTGHVLVTAYDEIWQVDPTTGTKSELMSLPGRDLDGLAFDPTFQLLYFNHDSGGVLGSTEWVPGAVSDTRVVANLTSGWAGELNGATVDECGNVYVTNTNGRIYRVQPDGTFEVWVHLTGILNTTSARFGSGIGGWRDDHLYVINRRGGAFEIPVGVRGRWEPHLPPRP